MSRETVELEVFRYSPESDAGPGYQHYRVPYHNDWLVLDALNYVKDHHATAIAGPVTWPFAEAVA